MEKAILVLVVIVLLQTAFYLLIRLHKKRRNCKCTMANEKSSKHIIIKSILICVIIWLILKLLSTFGFITAEDLSTFLAALALGGVIVSGYFQKEELGMQREEMKKQREEQIQQNSILSGLTDGFAKQNDNLSILGNGFEKQNNNLIQVSQVPNYLIYI